MKTKALVNLDDLFRLFNRKKMAERSALFGVQKRLDRGSPELNSRVRGSLLNTEAERITTFERQDGADKNRGKPDSEEAIRITS